MIEVTELIDGKTYLIEEFNPNGTSKRMRGKCTVFSRYLYRFDNVVRYKNGEIQSISWFHTARITKNTKRFHWKYYIPVDEGVKKQVEKCKIDEVLTKMLLLRKIFSDRIGDPSTIRGLIQNN